MHDELHPLKGNDPVHVASEAVTARFPHADHAHHVKVYPETWVCQVRWQHRVPERGFDGFGLAPAAMTFEAETCWYTLHDLGGPVFQRPWQVLMEGEWVPMVPLRRPAQHV